MKLISNLKRLGFKGFLKEWKKGMMKITPEDLLKAEIVGNTGMLLGSVLAVIFFIWVYDRMWTFAIIMGFNIIIQSAQLIEKKQRLEALKNFTNISNIEELFGKVPKETQEVENV